MRDMSATVCIIGIRTINVHLQMNVRSSTCIPTRINGVELGRTFVIGDLGAAHERLFVGRPLMASARWWAWRRAGTRRWCPLRRYARPRPRSSLRGPVAAVVGCAAGRYVARIDAKRVAMPDIDRGVLDCRALCSINHVDT